MYYNPLNSIKDILQNIVFIKTLSFQIKYTTLYLFNKYYIAK